MDMSRLEMIFSRFSYKTKLKAFNKRTLFYNNFSEEDKLKLRKLFDKSKKNKLQKGNIHIYHRPFC